MHGACTLVDGNAWKKLESRSLGGSFVGYADVSKDYLMYVMSLRQVVGISDAVLYFGIPYR